ncbi:hypothetical protein Tco_0490119 [Tanacetum coccineum]
MRTGTKGKLEGKRDKEMQGTGKRKDILDSDNGEKRDENDTNSKETERGKDQKTWDAVEREGKSKQKGRGQRQKKSIRTGGAPRDKRKKTETQQERGGRIEGRKRA